MVCPWSPCALNNLSEFISIEQVWKREYGKDGESSHHAMKRINQTLFSGRLDSGQCSPSTKDP